MSTIKIEFPADDKVAAAAFSTALATIAGGTAVAVPALEEHVHDAPETTAVTEPPAPPKSEEMPPAPPTPPAPPAAGAGTETTQTTGTAEDAGSASDVSPLDTKGVPFDEKYCAVAKEPFNSTGKRAGQWKKKRGLSEQEYDAWYEGELAKVAPAAPAGSGEETVPPVNTAAAFGGPAGGAPAPSLFDGPKDTGELMGWVSEKQAAGALTQDQVNQAFVTAGLSMADLFNKDAETLAANVAKVFAELVKVAQ